MPLLHTSRLVLVPATEAHLEAELSSRALLAFELDADVSEEWPPEYYDTDAVNHALRHVRADRANRDWGFYYVVLPACADRRATLIGAGGFKSQPDAMGEVELGYSVVPAYRRQGYAVEAVRGLTKFAFADSRVRVVFGQTLVSLPPSIGVLQKAGFQFAGEGNDPGAPEGECVIRYDLVRERFTSP